MSVAEPEITSTQTNWRWWLLLVLALGVLAVSLGFLKSAQPPENLSLTTPFVVESGLGASAVAGAAKDTGYVRSESLLYLVLVLLHDPASIKAGSYTFSEAPSVFELANRITGQAPPGAVVAVTFPEGFSVNDFDRIAAAELPAVAAGEIELQASTSEGYLFPDTYFVPTTYTAEELFSLLTSTFEDQVGDAIGKSELTGSEVVTLASILEREANTPESMKLVAGILYNRLEIGMPLQVDATMEYILDTPLSQLAPGQLANEIRTMDSPYNTYLYAGLPPTPIGNPGKAAIQAILEPTTSAYFYYITGNDGNFYYAETFNEHKRNIARYLR